MTAFLLLVGGSFLTYTALTGKVDDTYIPEQYRTYLFWMAGLVLTLAVVLEIVEMILDHRNPPSEEDD